MRDCLRVFIETYNVIPAKMMNSLTDVLYVQIWTSCKNISQYHEERALILSRQQLALKDVYSKTITRTLMYYCSRMCIGTF